MIAALVNIARQVLLQTRLREDGNVAVIFGIALPVLLGLTGLAIDGAAVNHQSSRMQNAADAAALAVAKELHVYRTSASGKNSSDTTELVEAGKAITEAHLETAGISERPHEVEIVVDEKASTAEVKIAMEAKTFLPSSVWAKSPLLVDSIARAYGAVKLCVLGLNRNEGGTVEGDKGAVLTAPECAVQSDSSDSEGIRMKNGSTVESSGTCSSGGVEGADAITPKPELDCPPIDDPLSERIAPTVSGCDYLDFEVDEGETTLSPGVYCGGIKMRNKAVVDLNPGIYIITGGKLDTGNKTILRGENVSFYFADNDATFEFKDNGLVELSAPKDGPMAGILFFANRKNAAGQRYVVSSDSARKLLGTIYLPNAVLEIGGTGKVADASAYTVIVVNRLEMDTANLVVNANYAASDVPVPDGLGPYSTSTALER